MLKPKRKIGKRELKQDALITTYAKVTAAYEEYKKPLGIALAVLAVSVLGYFVYQSSTEASEHEAAVKLAEIVTFFDAGNYTVAIEGIPEREIDGLRAIVEDHGGTTSGDQARLYLARALFQLDSYDEALDHFSRFSGRGDLMAGAREAGIAACYEGKGEYLDAAEHYERAAGFDSPDNLVAQYLNSAARNFARAGDAEKAAELYAKLKKEYPTTTPGRAADRYLAGLPG